MSVCSIRNFAGKSSPYIYGTSSLESVNLDLSGTKIKIMCPSSKWLASDSRNYVLPNVDVGDHQQYSPPSEYILNNFGDYHYKNVFSREWRLWGNYVHLLPLGLSSFAVTILYIKAGKGVDSLYNHDVYREKIKRPCAGDKLPNGAKVLTSGAGLLRPNRGVSYETYAVQGDNDRKAYARAFITLDSNHVLVFDSFHVRSPSTSRPFQDAQCSFFRAIFDSMIFSHSQQVLDDKEASLRALSELKGYEYDEEYMELLIPMDFSDVREELFDE